MSEVEEESKSKKCEINSDQLLISLRFRELPKSQNIVDALGKVIGVGKLKFALLPVNLTLTKH